jgi:predicted nucleic acid-binding Zn ribbon protein
MVVMKKCAICLNEFPRKGKRNYCSDECKAEGKRRHREAQVVVLKARAIECKLLRQDPNHIDPKWLVRGTISTDSGKAQT